MANWFIQQGEQRLGPMPLEALQNMAANGQVSPSDLVWTDGMASWQTAGSQPWYFSAAAPAPPTGMAFGGYAPANSSAYGIAPPPKPPNLLGWSIAVTLCCCIPGGIVGIVQSNKANSAWARGDYSEAQSAYESAKTTLIWSAVIGVVLNLIYGILKATHNL